MAQDKRNFELRYPGTHCFDPTGSFQLFYSGDVIGSAGRIMLSTVATHARIEVEVSDLSSTMKVIQVQGVPVVKVRTKFTGSIAGEWLTESAQDAADSQPPVSEGMSKPDRTHEPVTTARTSLAEPQRTPQPAPLTVRPAAAVPPPTPTAPKAREIPRTRICDQCASFRPYARVWERFQQEFATRSDMDAVSQGLEQLRSAEEKGKGEEAHQLADLYRRGSDRWPARPSFFSYCAAHEFDAAEPTCFIAQIRNADQRCRPVKRMEGQRWNDAITDFTPRDDVPHSCSTCVHRLGGPEFAEIERTTKGLGAEARAVAFASYYKPSDSGTIPQSIGNTLRRDAGASIVREMSQAFANRAMDSHLPVAPRFLATCRLKSDPARDRFRVCAVENANDSCAEWTLQT